MPSFPLFKDNNFAFEQIRRSMAEIGYTGELLAENYDYADILGNYKVKNVELAGFASIPRSYRNACIGVVNSTNISNASLVMTHRALGAPLFFVLTDNALEAWKVTEKGEPEFKETVSHEQIANFFRHNASNWQPDRIFRAKVIGEIETVSQLDFFDVGLMPLLEGMIHKKLDRLLGETLKEIEGAYQQFVHSEPDFKDLYRLVFRFIVAKVMQDRNHLKDFSDANQILEYIEKYYSLSTDVLHGVKKRNEIIDVTWKAISGQFHFQNLSVDDLAFIYENSFVTKENRKFFGTHSTPPRVAEYIVRKLPFEEVDIEKRYTLEPCAGHGAFLVPALRRLRELLPSTISIEDRHKYLTERITGIEIDPFAIEACWSRLVLADYPHPNGWKLLEKDVFEGDTLVNETKKADILFCNPPFEDFSPEQKDYYQQFTKDILTQKPAEILHRIMQYPPALLGLVLPKRFQSSSSYRQFHRKLAETYDYIEIVDLPEIFNFSDATPTLIMASGKREHFGSVAVSCRYVAESEKKDFFKGFEPTAAKAVFTAEDYLQPDFSLWVAPLSRIWDYLKPNLKLSSVGEIHRGIEWKAREDTSEKIRKEISDKSKKGYKKGYAQVASGAFRQYLVQNQVYLSMLPEDQRIGNYQFDWDKPKVVFNAARLARNAWRLGSVADNEGVVFSKQFFAIWLKENFSIYAIAAILNSPLANAFVFSHSEGRDNHAKIIQSIPLPNISSLRVGGVIDQLSYELHEQINDVDSISAKNTLLKIDAEIMRQYNLPPYLERELLDSFQNIPRPVPFEFKGYYPDGFTAYISLHELISEEFQEAQADQLLKRLTFLDDPEITEALSVLYDEGE